MVQRATECENMGQKKEACFLQLLWKGRCNTGGVLCESEISLKIWEQETVAYVICQPVTREQHLGTEEGRVPCMDSCLGVLLGLTARCRGQAFTLKRMSVHIAFPCVIIGSWSSPLPSQQSSSTHLETQEKRCQLP